MNHLARYFENYEDIEEGQPHRWENRAASNSATSATGKKLTADEQAFDERASRETENRMRKNAKGYRQRLAKEKKTEEIIASLSPNGDDIYRLETIWEDGSRTTLIVKKITIQKRINGNGESVKMAWVQEYPEKNILYIHLFEIHSITKLTEKEKRKYRLMDAHRRVKNFSKQDKIERARRAVEFFMRQIIKEEKPSKIKNADPLDSLDTGNPCSNEDTACPSLGLNFGELCSSADDDLSSLRKILEKWLKDHKILSRDGDDDRTKRPETATPLQPAVETKRIETKSGANSKAPKEKPPKRTRGDFLPTDAFFRRVAKFAQALYLKN